MCGAAGSNVAPNDADSDYSVLIELYLIHSGSFVFASAMLLFIWTVHRFVLVV